MSDTNPVIEELTVVREAHIYTLNKMSNENL